jgi:hypothetical protein
MQDEFKDIVNTLQRLIFLKSLQPSQLTITEGLFTSGRVRSLRILASLFVINWFPRFVSANCGVGFLS